MAGKRLVYLAVLFFSGIFYIAYGQWLSFLLLVTVLALPWFSLLLTLPAIFRFKAAPSGPSLLEMGDAGELWLMGSAPCPMPPFRGRLKLTRLTTGESWYYQEPVDLPTDHCGGLQVTMESLRISDYLDLFSFPVKCRDKKTILIRPRPVPMPQGDRLARQIIQSWKPRPGGGYAENHELRLYRPGDSLNQVHWKLSAKTGSLILREAMEPRMGPVVLTLHLRGDPDRLDRKLGRLLWLGQRLLEQNLSFRIHALTADGILTFPVAGEDTLTKAIDALLCCRPAETGDLRNRDFAAAWHCHIGGDADEP